MMSKPVKRLYEFGPFQVDAAERLLLRDGEPVSLTPKAFDTLLILVENSGHALGKDELMRRVWPDTFVEENNLSQNISLLRKALGDGAKYIETVPRLGYRFMAKVRITEIDESASLIVHERIRARVHIEEETDQLADMQTQPATAAPPALIRPGRRHEAGLLLPRPPETRYARSGDVNIAYQVVGDAPLDLVFVMGWVSHLEYFWAEPSFARFLMRLASFSRLILFDKRGTGLSDRVPVTELPTLEQRMDDVRAVMEAVGSERAALCGVSEGGPMCSLFAATYPEKTVALVMIGTYARRLWAPDHTWAPTAEQHQRFYDLMQREWGGPVGLEERAPSVAADPAFRDWWATYLRMGASPGAALALTRMNADIDVRHVLPLIRVPTLVIHRTGDACLKVEEGRYVAQMIPGARYVELPGVDHLPFVGDQDAILDEVEEFLTGVRHALEPDRVLATVLVTHIDGAARAATGDARWRDLLERHQAYVKREIEWFRGRISETMADGFLATFDGPARAIRAACAIVESGRRLGIEIRAGLHTGECDMMGDRVGGVAVQIGTHIAAQAAPGEVLVSSTVKDLVAGSGIQFHERGLRIFQGLPGEWRLFAIERGGCLKPEPSRPQ
jgi:DNA-binding winged helix-turn-helix (wHTH) protein/pimeloyl-ACP methyl ester carboxylesterase